MSREDWPRPPSFEPDDSNETDHNMTWFHPYQEQQASKRAVEKKMLVLPGDIAVEEPAYDTEQDEPGLAIGLDPAESIHERQTITLETDETKPGVPETDASSESKGPMSWKLAQERAAETDPVVLERKQWLENAWHDKGRSGEPASVKGKLKQEIAVQLEMNARRGNTGGLIDKRFGRMEDAVKAKAVLEQYSENPVSLQELLAQAKTMEDLRTLKIFSAAFLEAHARSNAPKTWAEVSESQKQFTRLGEIVGLEAERRMIEMTMDRGRQMKPDVAQRAYERYSQYCLNPDIPNDVKEKFTKMAERLEREYTVRKGVPKSQRVATPEAQAGQAVPVGQSFEGVKVKEMLTQVRIDNLRKMKPEAVRQLLYGLAKDKQKILDADPNGVGAEFQEIAESQPGDMVEYNPGVIANLKVADPCADPKAEARRLRFIDSMDLQMSHAAFLNSNPSTWDRLFRGTVDGVRTRWQVLGVGMFWPFGKKSGAEKMAQAREDVANSWGVLAQSETYDARDSAMAHAIELSMVNANELLRHGYEVQTEEDVYGSKLNDAYQASLKQQPDIYDVAAQRAKELAEDPYEMAARLSQSQAENTTVPQEDWYDVAAQQAATAAEDPYEIAAKLAKAQSEAEQRRVNDFHQMIDGYYAAHAQSKYRISDNEFGKMIDNYYHEQSIKNALTSNPTRALTQVEFDAMVDGYYAQHPAEAESVYDINPQLYSKLTVVYHFNPKISSETLAEKNPDLFSSLLQEAQRRNFNIKDYWEGIKNRIAEDDRRLGLAA